MGTIMCCGIEKVINSALNFVEEVKEHVKNTEIDEELAEKRMEVCKTCDQYTGGFCSACFCFLKIKTKWVSSKCPLEKWEI